MGWARRARLRRWDIIPTVGMRGTSGSEKSELETDLDRALLSLFPVTALAVTEDYRILARRGDPASFGLPDSAAEAPREGLGFAIRDVVRRAASGEKSPAADFAGVARAGAVPLQSASDERVFVVTLQSILGRSVNER